MRDHGDGVIAACLESLEFTRDMCESIVQPPSAPEDADLHQVQGRWMAFDAIFDKAVGQVPDRTVHQYLGTTATDVLSRARQGALKPGPQEQLVAALSLAVNEAVSGSPRRLERFLSSDSTVEQLLQARGAAKEMASEPGRLYLRFLYSAILTWAAARETIKSSVRQRPLSPLPTWRFARVQEYIDLHIEEPIRLQDLAKVAGLSRMHFAAQFRAYTGISPCEFVTMQRAYDMRRRC